MTSSRKTTQPDQPPAKLPGFKATSKWSFRLLLSIALFAGILTCGAVYMALQSNAALGLLAQDGWSEYAAHKIVNNKVYALWHAAGMAVICLTAFALLLNQNLKLKRWLRSVIIWLLVLIVAADAVWLSRHYIHTMPLPDFSANNLVNLLHHELKDDQRAAMLTQDGFYNFYLTYLFPYHKIRVVNIAQMPRMQKDYQKFLQAIEQDPARLWQIMAVKCILMPAEFWMQLEKTPLGEVLEPIYAYNVSFDEAGQRMQFFSANHEHPGKHLVANLKLEAPYCALINGWRSVSDEETLSLLASPDYPLFQELLIAPEHFEGLKETPAQGLTGKVTQGERKPGYLRLSVSVSQEPAFLRVAEKYDPGWKAWVDGVPAPVRRVDYLFQGVWLEPGLHEVVLRYTSEVWTLILQIVVLALCVVAGFSFFWTFRKNRNTNTS